MILLFGVKYSTELSQLGVKIVIEESGLRSAYATEVAKAAKLARYVKLI
jgi:hypothetical protein